MGCAALQEYPSVLNDSPEQSQNIDLLRGDLSQNIKFTLSDIPVVKSAEQDSRVSEVLQESVQAVKDDNEQKHLPQFLLKQRKNHLKFRFGSLLGTGSFGKVYSAIEFQTGQLLAVKIIDLQHQSSNQKAEIFKEISTLQQLKHQNIVKIYDYFEEENQLYIVMEALKMSLSSLVLQFNGLPELYVSKLAFQTASALSYLHQQSIAHCDIKAANLMLSSDNQLKLVDFGSATSDNPCSGVRGSPYWLAPEILKKQQYDPFKADCWSFGCTVFEMKQGRPPFSQFKSAPAVLFHLSELQQPPEITNCSNKMRYFLKKILQIDPEKRISIDQILNDQFLHLDTKLPPIGLQEQELNENNSPEASEEMNILKESMIGSPEKPSILKINSTVSMENQNEELLSKPNWGDTIQDIGDLIEEHDSTIFCALRPKLT